jgi:hypothetical protein
LLAALSLIIAAAHPQLFFSQNDVGPLREAAASSHREIASHITSILDAHLGDAAPTGLINDPSIVWDLRFYGNQVAVWAFAYQLTGNTAYAAKARQQLLTYLTWPDWSFGETTSTSFSSLQIGHMLSGTSAAYDWIYPYLSDVERQQIAARIGNEANQLALALPTTNAWYAEDFVCNHNWIATAGLGMAALALQGEDARASGWLKLAEDNLAKLKLALGPISDGTYHESFGYEGYGLSMSLPFWTALARTGADYTDMGLLRGLGKYLLYNEIPDVPRQMILPAGDFSGWSNQQQVEVARYTAARFRDPLAAAAAQRWLGGGSRATNVPELWYEVFEFLYHDPTVVPADVHAQPLDADLPDTGGAILHSSWDRGDLAVGFKAGPYGGRVNFERIKTGGAPGGSLNWGHDHNDAMSFWIFGNGTWLAPETVGFSAGSLHWANPANQTAYHNGMLIDGQGELGEVRTSDTEYANPWFWNRDASPLLTAVGTADYAIAGGRGASLFDSSVGLTRWDRMLVLARSRYVLVRDDLQAQTPHAFDWISHFTDGASVETANGWVQGINKNGQSLGVRVVSPAQWTATTGSQTALHNDLAGLGGSTTWVRVRPAAPAAQVQFLTALVPVATSAWPQKARIDALSAQDPGAGAVVAPGSALEERWIFSRTGSAGQAAGDLALTGSLAGVAARNAAGVPVRAALFGAGRIADQGGTRELLSSRSARSIEADLQGATLAITGDSIADFHAYSLTATSVTLNGTTVSATFESGMITYPAGLPGGGTDGGTGLPDAGGSAPDAGNPGGDKRVTLGGFGSGCSTGTGAGWLAALGALALFSRRGTRRRSRS